MEYPTVRDQLRAKQESNDCVGFTAFGLLMGLVLGALIMHFIIGPLLANIYQ